MYFTNIVWLLYDKRRVRENGRQPGHPLAATGVVKGREDGSLLEDASGGTPEKWAHLKYILEELTGLSDRLDVD